MEQTIPPFFLFVSLALCLTLSHAVNTPTLTGRKVNPNDAMSPAAAQPPVAAITVDQACSNANDKTYCIQALSSRRETKGQLSMKDMAFLTLTIAGEDIDESYRFLSEMPVEDNDQQAPGFEDAVQDCLGQYEDAAAQVEDSMNAFVAGAYNDLQTWMSAAIKNGETCSASIKDANVKDFMATRNANLAKICGLAMDLSKVALNKQ